MDKSLASPKPHELGKRASTSERIDLPRVFSALGDKTRIAIIKRLLEKGEQPAGALLDVADISAPAISRHLRILREAGLLHQRVDKQRRLYSINKDLFAYLKDWFAHSGFLMLPPVLMASR